MTHLYLPEPNTLNFKGDNCKHIEFHTQAEICNDTYNLFSTIWGPVIVKFSSSLSAMYWVTTIQQPPPETTSTTTTETMGKQWPNLCYNC